MNIAKFNIAPGSGSNASVGSTAVAGGGGSGYSVDLTPLTEKIAALESKVSQMELLLSGVRSILSGLDGRFLSRLGDRSDYSYHLGALYSDFLQSEMFGNGVGFRLSGNATATVDDKYNLIIKDVGWASIAFNTVLQNDATMVDSNTDEATAQLTTSFISIGQTIADGYMLVDCGAILTNERCFTEVAKIVEYSVRFSIGQQSWTEPYKEAEADSNGNYILYFQHADSVSIAIRFKYTYSFRQYGDTTSGTYRLYIQGTDPEDNQTDCFAASSKTTTVNASGVTVMEGDNGARITKNGVQITHNGGTTWV